MKMGAKGKRRSYTGATFAVVVVVVLMTYGAPCSNAEVALFVFGDSVYDVGNYAYTLKNASSKFLPYGELYFHKPVGRFCDGRVIPDYIAQYAGIPFVPPYLEPNLTDYTKGVSFAYAGAPVLVEDDTSSVTIDLTRQVGYFLRVVEKLKAQIGVSETRILLGRAVYLFTIGGIDYSDLAKKYINTSLSSSVISDFTTMVIGNITSHVQTIYKKGGRKFGFQNVGPLGCFPATRQTYAEAGKESETCIPQAQYLAIQHNIRFSEAARNLMTQLPGFCYSIFDYFTQAHNRFLYPNLYGFEVTKEACCGSGIYNANPTCASSSEEFNLCSDPHEYLFFDAEHPTDKANGQFSRMFWSGGPDVVGPFTLKDLFTMSPASFSSNSYI